ELLPSDLTGTMTLRPSESAGSAQELAFRAGPVFTHVLLADEINRTPPKTQSALLEAMQERQVSVDGEAHPLPDPFLVIATQNPIEYEGTYPLPEAQLDRFLVKVDVGYPSEDNEVAMLKLGHRGVVPSTRSGVGAVPPGRRGGGGAGIGASSSVSPGKRLVIAGAVLAVAAVLVPASVITIVALVLTGATIVDAVIARRPPELTRDVPT